MTKKMWEEEERQPPMGGFPRGRRHLNNKRRSQTTVQKGVISVNQPCHNRDGDAGILGAPD